MQIARFGRLCGRERLFPNGQRNDARQQPRSVHSSTSTAACSSASSGCGARRRVLLIGDLNTAPARSISRARSRTYEQRLPARGARRLDRWLAAGWVDTFRAFEPGAGHYSLGQRFGMRAKMSVADRLRARVAVCDGLRARRVHRARLRRLGPRSGRRRVDPGVFGYCCAPRNSRQAIGDSPRRAASSSACDSRGGTRSGSSSCR